VQGFRFTLMAAWRPSSTAMPFLPHGGEVAAYSRRVQSWISGVRHRTLLLAAVDDRDDGGGVGGKTVARPGTTAESGCSRVSVCPGSGRSTEIYSQFRTEALSVFHVETR
jgi:hypothetical protein